MNPIKPKTIHRNQVRLERHETKNACTVRSIGAARAYSFHTKNLSETGLLIAGSGAQYEFNKSTILEVCLVDERINFLAKVIRIHDNEFGLKIIQSERDEAEKYLKLLNLLSRRAAAEIKLHNVS